MRTLVFFIPVLLAALYIPAWGAEDYANFAALPEKQKGKIVWDLFDKNQFGKPEHKPICRDLLATQGKYAYANATGFTSSAIALAEKQGWNDLRELVATIYRNPTSIWLYEASFHCLRAFSGKPVPSDIRAATDKLRLSGAYQSTITEKELAAAQQRLLTEPDKEMVLVYALYAAGWHPGKGGTERGRKAAADILKTLPQDRVRSRLKNLRDHFDKEVNRPEIEWVNHYLYPKSG
jgi:hypothetical protein